MRAAILGGTKGMGRALARRFAERGDEVVLLGRDPADLARSAADLEARGAPAPVGRIECDLERPEGFARALAETGGVDVVVLSAGVFAPQDDLEGDFAATERLLRLDFTNAVLFCEAAREHLLARGGGTLCAFGSVAGDRGRQPVALYGAAKAGLAAYLEALDARHRRKGLRVVCVKPGFVKTAMTEGLPVPPFAGDPDAVSRRVLRAIDRGTPVVYAPPIWRWILFVLRRMPREFFRRIPI